jgi:VWFA-related protein
MFRRCNLLAWFTFWALQSSGQNAKDDLNIRVSVNLVQIDVTVTGAHGKPVGDLTASDFELLLDGSPQPITHFSHIQRPVPPPATITPVAAIPSSKNRALAGGPGPAPLKPEQVSRVMAIFVDDLSLAAQTVPQVGRGVTKAIQEQIGPRDLTAIVRASAGLGALQDFTTDRRLLLAAVDQIRWNPSGSGAMTAYEALGDNRSRDQGLLGADGQASAYDESENTRDKVFTVAVLDSLRRVIHGMAGMPGRKAVVVLSDRLPLALRDTSDVQVRGASARQFDAGSLIMGRMNDCIGEAARNGVVIYAVDTRGLATLMPDASAHYDVSSFDSAVDMASVPAKYSAALHQAHDQRQEGGWYLASQTGGIMIPETNDIGASIGKVYADMQEYYLLGFTPPETAFEPGPDGRPKFRNIKVRVKRPGLQARSRSGFLGAPDQPEAAPGERAELRLASSLESPFGSSVVDLHLRSSFLSARNNEWLATVSLWVDAHDLTLAGPVYNRSGIIHLLVRTFGVSGGVLDGGIDKMLRVSLNEEGYTRAMRYGLVYSTTLEIKKPGPYQVRAALLDQASGNIGTASQFLSVPNITKRNIALSGIVFPSMMSKEDDITPAAEAVSFAPGQRVPFAMEIIGGAGGKGFLSTTLLYRDGVLIFKSDPQPVEASKKTLHGSIFVRANLDIPSTAEAGEYKMQVLVTEGAAAPARKTATQWADLTVGSATHK